MVPPGESAVNPGVTNTCCSESVNRLLETDSPTGGVSPFICVYIAEAPPLNSPRGTESLKKKKEKNKNPLFPHPHDIIGTAGTGRG